MANRANTLCSAGAADPHRLLCDTALWATTLMKTLNWRQQALYKANIVAGVLLAAVFAVFLTPLAFASAGAALAAPLPAVGTAVTGTSVIADAAARQIPSVSEVVDEYDQAVYPIQSLIERYGGLNVDEAIRNPKGVLFEYLERSPYQRWAQVNGASTAGSAGAAKTVTVDAGHIFVPGFVVKDFGNATDPSLDYLVRSVTATSITIVALPKSTLSTREAYITPDDYGTVPAFADNAYLQWVGVLKSEKDAASQAIRQEPTSIRQLIQTMDQVASLSDHAMRIGVYGDGALEDETVSRNVGEFKRTREFAYLLQEAPSKTEDTNFDGSDEKYWKMRGVRGFVNQTITLPDSPTLSDIIAFNFLAHRGLEPPKTKILVAGSGLMERIDTVTAASDIVRTVQGEGTLGLAVRRIEGTPGNLDLWHQKMLDEVGLEDEGFVLDLDFMGRSVMQEVEERGGGMEQKNSGSMVDKVTWQLISKEALVMRRTTGPRTAHWRVAIA